MEADSYTIASRLAGVHIDRLVPCRSGRNSRVYKVVSGSGTYALKRYPARAADPRDRFGAEMKALRYYEASGNPYVPRLLAVDEPHGAALLEWIEGDQIGAPVAADIDQAIDFIARTHAAEGKGGEAFDLAAEPCLCGADLEGHLRLRLENLAAVVRQEPELEHFLAHELEPLWARVREAARGAGFSMPLPRSRQSLIPADFGFHNAIRAAGGKAYFIDFEYFGWDDPVRLTADFLLHPGTELGEENRDRFRRGMTKVFLADGEFEQRLLQLLPLYGIRWVLILLNEFLPERWQARKFAGETASWESIKTEQLAKARLALGRAEACLVRT